MQYFGAKKSYAKIHLVKGVFIMYKINKILCILVCLMPIHCWAHVRWFVQDVPRDNIAFPIDIVSILLVLGVLLYCSFCIFLKQQKNTESSVYRILHGRITIAGIEWNLLKASLAVMLVGNIMTNIFIAPNLVGVISPNFAIFLQATLIVLLVLDEVIFGLSLALLMLSVTLLFGVELAIDYIFEFIVFAIYFVILGLSKNWLKLDQHILNSSPVNTTAVSILRVGMGLQLMVLAIHNKLLNPGLTLAFLAEYPHFNFVKFIGIEAFTHIHFVLAAGLAELSFGLMLVANIATRFVATCVMFFFTLTSIILGPHELLGHSPVLASMLIIWLQGNLSSNQHVYQTLQLLKPGYILGLWSKLLK